MNQSTTTALSVIVVSFNEPAILRKCLDALNCQRTDKSIEVIVVRDWGARDLEADAASLLKKDFADVVWIDAPANSTVPGMRKLALSTCHGKLVGFIEDDCVVSDDWCARVVDAHKSANVAIGGAVEPGNYKRNIDWAVFFCEYARFMRPFAGIVAALPGNNVTYKTDHLHELLEQTDSAGGIYEVFVHGALQQSGGELKADPTLSVQNINSWKLSNLMAVPYHHGRGFAAMRLPSRPLLERLPFVGIAVVLPAVQIMRIGRQILSKGRYPGKFLQCLPQVGLFCVSWSVGEFIGYLFGPGRSLKEWR